MFICRIFSFALLCHVFTEKLSVFLLKCSAPALYLISANKEPKAEKKPLKSAKSRQTAARVALMKLKGRAEGNKGVPDTERVFFSVALPLASKLTPKALFFSKVSDVFVQTP